MAVFEVGDNELPRKKGYLGWGEKIGTPTILDSDCRSENKHRIQNLSFVSLSQSKNSFSLVYP